MSTTAVAKSVKCRYCGKFGPWEDRCCQSKSCVAEYKEACNWAKAAAKRILSHYPKNYFDAK